MAQPKSRKFFLYGGPQQEVAGRFVHLESLDVRLRASNWTVRPHTHAGLCQLFYIEVGAGTLAVEGDPMAFQAPCLLAVPAGVVHGFLFSTDTYGAVLTISDAYAEDFVRREPQLAAVFDRAAILGVPGGAVPHAFQRLRQELSWTAPGRDVAVEALLLTLFVEALRLRHCAAGAPSRAGRQGALVVRFRGEVEQHYRVRPRVEDYATALQVSSKQLRSACLGVAGLPPVRIIQDRVLLEAKRLLLYSHMTIAEIAYHLGFEDPAYFTRFFSRGCNVSPRRFRASGGRTPDTAARLESLPSETPEDREQKSA